MYRTKNDVDHHVAKILAKVNANDRNYRAYSIARMYFDVADYETCVKYVRMYLNVKDNNPAAHTLLGQAYHKLGQVDKALAEYKASLNLDHNQSNLVLKVCELMCMDNVPLDLGSGRYWAERAAALCPGHPVLFTLMTRMLTAEGAGAPATAALLKKEVSARPHDPIPRARLLRHMLQTTTIDEAFTYAFETHFSMERIEESTIWNDSVVEVINKLNSNSQKWDYWLLKITVLERLADLSLAEGRGPSEAVTAIWQLDRALFEASQCVLNMAPSRVLASEFLSHFGAQLCFHAATLLLKKNGREVGGWREAMQAAAPLLFLSLQPPMSFKQPPVPASGLPPAATERLMFSWYKVGAFRRSQAGHTLRACLKEKKAILLEKVSQYCSGAHWRDRLYKKLFTTKEQLERMTASYFLTSSEFAEFNIRLPLMEDLKLPDEVASLLRPGSLHHQVWVGSNAEHLADAMCRGIDELRLSLINLSNCSAESLNKLDMDTFLYCTILTAKQNAEKERKSGYRDPERPLVLPAVLMPQLCTPSQAKWWDAAWKMGCIGNGDLSDFRLTLTRGIETIRCVGSHGLDPELLVEVARAFAKRSDMTKDTIQRKFLEARAYLYYSSALPLFERIRNNISIRPPEKRLFDYEHGELPADKLDMFIEESKLYLAVKCINDNENEKAIEILETIKSAYASYHLFTIYKKSASEISTNREISDPEKIAKQFTNLSKARELIYLTMDRLKASHANSDHPLYTKLSDQIEDVDRMLSRVEMLDNSKRANNYFSDDDSIPGCAIVSKDSSFITYTPRSTRSERISRRSEPQPSPESLEAQIRQLQRKNSIFSAFVEQTKVLVDSNRTLVEEVREMKKTLGDIKSHNIEDTVNQFKSLKLSVDEVKCKINEYKEESAADVADLKREITELKKELGKIKSSPTTERQQQIDDNELFMLEEEAGSFFQRQPQPPVLPPQPYPIYPPGALYPLYSQYPSVPQIFPGALFQDQPLYSELLAPRSLPAPQPVPPPVQPIPVPAPALPPQQPLTLQPVLPNPQLTTHQADQPSQPAIHNYHIPLPHKTVSFPTVTTTSTPNKPLLGAATNDSAPPKLFSLFDSPKPANISDTKSFSFLGSPGAFDSSKTGLDKSRTMSERSTDSYDPIPDFKPIIELPDEVPVTTGEEDEEVLFNSRAKLFRFVAKEWKERGLGNIKLLKNKITGKVRVLMRRERVHTICANHIISAEIEISPMKDREKAYFWGANDFADQAVQYEKFCIRFKTVEIGQDFYDKFCKARDDSKLNSSLNQSLDKSTVQSDEKKDSEKDTNKEPEKPSDSSMSLGGLKFFNTPTIKKVETPAAVVSGSEPVKPNPFAGFTFNKTTSTATPVVNVFSLSKTTEHTSSNSNLSAGDNNQVLFENSGKVQSVESNSTFYKEKGVGIVKIISSNDNTLRLLIVQDKTEVVWCDHPLTKDTKFEALMIQLNTLAWKTPQGVSMRVTFPSAAVCESFKTASAEAFKRAEVSGIAKKQDASKEIPAELMIPITVSGWGDKFKPKVGTWDCKSCYVNNEATAENCAACNSPKNPPAAKEEAKPAPAPKAAAPVTTPQSGWGDKFKPKQGSWDCKSCYINNDANNDYCVACDSPKDPSMPKKENKSALAAPTGPAKFTFGIPAANGTTPGQSIFGMPAVSSTPKPTSFTFGIPSTQPEGVQNKTVSFVDLVQKPSLDIPLKSTFEFKMKIKSPVKDKNVSLDKSQDSDNEYVQEDDGEHITFTPIVPLPDKVEVKTGEEEEEVLYKHLAKIFRFSGGEWREAGVGDIKVLKHPNTGKLRILMRREPIHKICLNHVLNDNIKYIAKDERTWLFSANDFSSGELTLTQFCVRFKTKDIAQDFLAAVDKARSEISKTSSEPKQPVADKAEESKSEEEVVFVSEIKATDEEIAEARKLMLPDNFYTYKQKESCKGCVGCDPDNYVFKTDDKPTEVKAEPKKEPEPANKPNAFVFGQNSSFGNMGSATSTIFGSTPGFGSGNIFGGKGDSGSIFSGKPTAEVEKKTLLAAPKFAFATTTASVAEFTSGQPLFSANVFSSNSGSIFGNAVNTTGATLTSQTVSTPSVFGFKPATAESGTNNAPTSIFGAKDPSTVFGTKSATSIFGAKEPGSIFGVKEPVFGAKESLFGTKEPGSIFGAKEPSTVFGSKEPSTIFGAKDSSNAFIAKESNASLASKEPSTIFTKPADSTLFKSPENTVLTASTAPAFSTPANLSGGGLFSAKPFGFGSTDAKPNIVFGQNNKSGTIFGGGADLPKTPASTVIKGPETKPENGQKEVAPGVTLGLGVSSDLSFSALAAKTQDVPVKPEDKKQPFSWAGAGMPLFGGAKTKAGADTSQGGQDDSHEGEGEYDPHYEPVVPMPDEIKVVTGEEDEVVKFEQKAKLFRFTLEWKERGLGNLKLLYHPDRKTYRLLLRQSQVHKVVLNQLVTRDLNMLPMSKSDRAFMWAGINYTEDAPQGTPEKVAVRFGTPEQAQAFLAKINQVIQELEERAELNTSGDEPSSTAMFNNAADVIKSAQTTASVEATPIPAPVESVTVREEHDDEGEGGDGDREDNDDENEDEDDDEYRDYAGTGEYYEDYGHGEYGHEDDDEHNYYNSDDELTVIYESTAVVDGSPAQVILYLGPQGGHLRVFRDDQMIYNTYVGGATMECNGTICKWKGEYEEEDWVTAEFPSEEVAATLQASFLDM